MLKNQYKRFQRKIWSSRAPDDSKLRNFYRIFEDIFNKLKRLYLFIYFNILLRLYIIIIIINIILIIIYFLLIHILYLFYLLF